MGNFNNLNLDKSKIYDELCALQNCTIECTNDTVAKTTYTIKKDQISCIVIVHHKKDGTSTLQIQGKNHELGKSVCSYIKEKTQIFKLTEINQSVIITDENFEELLNLVKTNFSDLLTEKEIPGGIAYTLNKSRDGKFTFTFYNKSKKLLLQGKTLLYFSFIVNILTDQGYDIFNQILEGTQEIQLEESDKLLSEHLPSLAPKLNESIKKIITPSLQLVKVTTNFPDFSIILFPALKTLEHVIISILEENNFEYNPKTGFNMFSLWSPTNSYQFCTDTTQLNGTTKDKLEACYTFYHKQRHGLFHLGADLTEIRMIESREEAIALLMECIELMEDISDDFPA